MLVFLVGLYVSSSSDLDSYAHAKLSVPSYNNIAMVIPHHSMGKASTMPGGRSLQLRS